MKRLLLAIVLGLAVAPGSGYAQSTPATQEFSACIARSTTTEDNVILTKWLFVAIARHPSLSGLSNIPDSERVSTNRRMGALFNRLILDACANEARAAFRADGQRALEAPFEAFGRRAMEDIMGHADVNAAVAEMASYFDQQSLAELMNEQGE